MFVNFFKNIIVSNYNAWKIFLLNKYKFRKKVSFQYSVLINPNSTFEGANKIGGNSYFSGEMGYGSYIGERCSLIARIGRFSSIAPDVKNSIGKHPYSEPYVATSPMFYSLAKQNGYTFAKVQMFKELVEPTIIGNDCWIGQQAFLVGGINIGDGAVVLAGAVVVDDVPAYAIVGGVPAKLLKYRYDKETISYLLRIKWWEMSIDWLSENWKYLCNIDELKKNVK